MRLLKILSATAVTVLLVATTPANADPQQLYDFYCTQCHGAGGKGDGVNVTKSFPVKPRSFTDAKEMEKLSDANLKNAIRDGGPALGKSPFMPPWGKTLSDTEIDALVAHLRQLCACSGKKG